MKKTLVSSALLSLLIQSTAMAADYGIEAVPMVYFKLPIGAPSASSYQPSFGLAVASSSQERKGGIELFSQRPAFFDLRFQNGEIEGLRFNGVQTLQRQTRLNADGSTSSSSSINWPLVGVGVAAVGFAIYKANEDDDDDAPAGGGSGGAEDTS